MEVDNLVELVLAGEEDGVFAISFVNEPAIESDFIALSKEDVKLKVTNEEKRIVTGAILIPDKPILRTDKYNKPYHIFFSKDTVLQLSEKYLKEHNQESVTIEHEVPVENITLVESWIKIDGKKDKTIALGIDAPVGSWIGSFKVDDEDVWLNLVKEGLVRGFSIEASLKRKINKNEIKMSEQKEMTNSTLFEKITELFSSKKEVAAEEVKTEVKLEEVIEEPKEEVVYITKEEFESEIKRLEDLISPAKEEVGQEAPQLAKAEPIKEVEMITKTDEVELSVKKIKFNKKLTTQERIKESLGI